jgi:hypothetical protein
MIHATSEADAHGSVVGVTSKPVASSRRRNRCTATRLAFTMTARRAVQPRCTPETGACVSTACTRADRAAAARVASSQASQACTASHLPERRRQET